MIETKKTIQIRQLKNKLKEKRDIAFIRFYFLFERLSNFIDDKTKYLQNSSLYQEELMKRIIRRNKNKWDEMLEKMNEITRATATKKVASIDVSTIKEQKEKKA